VNRVLKGLGESGDYEARGSSVHEGVGLDPKLPRSTHAHGFIYLSRNEKQKARAEAARLREEYPNDVGVSFLAWRAVAAGWRVQRSAAQFDRMVRLNGRAIYF